MTDTIGFGTAFQDSNNPYDWQGAEAIGLNAEEVIGAIRNMIHEYGVTEAEFNAHDPLYLTEVRKVRQITWDDVK